MRKKEKWIKKNFVSLFLLLILAGSLFLIFQILIPYGILSSDVGTNLGTEISGIILTIFFIDQLFHWNERRLWKKVEDKVFSRLGEELYYIIIDLINYIKLPSNLITFGVGPGESVDDAGRRNFRNKVSFVYNAKSLEMNKLFKKMIEKQAIGQVYDLRKQYLDNIETKYFKFFTPEILIPLMNIQKRLHSLNIRISQRQHNIQVDSLFLMNETEFNNIIAKIILMIFKDIQKLEDNGINVYLD